MQKYFVAAMVPRFVSAIKCRFNDCGSSSFLRYDIVTSLIMLLCLNKHYITKKSNLKKRRHCKLWQYILSWKIIKDGSLRNKRRLYFHSFYRRLFGDVEIYCVDEFTPLYLLISHTQLFMHGCILVYHFLVGSREKMLEFWGRYIVEKPETSISRRGLEINIWPKLFRNHS